MPAQVYNHQAAEPISDELLEKFTLVANKAFPMAIENRIKGAGILCETLEVEISIVDDATISQVHEDFMDIPGATDVITFSHGDSGVGEIVISAETARIYGAEYGHSFETELILYIIHGFLHLAGHEDGELADREAMERIQFSILKEVWSG